MKKYTVALVRERLADALDEADRGLPVIIERRGVRYRLARELPRRRRTVRAPRLDVLDRSIVEGQWTWDQTAAGLRFRGRRRA